jgi:hypothetical protein
MLTIETERLVLRLLQLSDQESMELLIDDYEAAKTTLHIPHPYPKGSAESFIKYRTEKAKDGMTYEGTFPQHMLKWEQYEDIAYYGMLKADFKC